MPGFVSEEEIEAYRRDGYVVVAGLIEPEELERLGHEVDRGVGHRKFGDTRKLAEKTRYEQCFQQCMNLWEDCPGVRPLTFHPRICAAAAELAGVPRLRLWHDQALYKDAGGRATDAHQDHPYWPLETCEAITAWIPFDGSRLESGAMAYVPGSHRFGARKFVNIFGHKDPYDILAGPEARGVPPVWVEVPKGSVAFHHSLTIHLAKPNQSAQMRRVHTMILFEDGARRGYEYPHFSVDRFPIALGAPVDSPATPLAYPRAPGDFPEPPGDRPFFLRGPTHLPDDVDQLDRP